MKYTYNEYLRIRELSELVEASFALLEKKGINPKEFYQHITENPEAFTDSEVAINELLGRLGDAGKAIAGGFNNFGAGGRARRTQQDIDWLKKNADAAKNAGFGDINDPNNPYIQQLGKEKATQQAAAGRGFLGNVGAAWNQARQDRSDAERQQKLAGYQQRFGIGPFAQTPAAPTTPTPTAPASGSASSPPRDYDDLMGGGAPVVTPPAPTPTPPGPNPEHITLAKQLNGLIPSLSGGAGADASKVKKLLGQIVKALQA
jgi:hypothetical protein